MSVKFATGLLVKRLPDHCLGEFEGLQDIIWEVIFNSSGYMLRAQNLYEVSLSNRMLDSVKFIHSSSGWNAEKFCYADMWMLDIKVGDLSDSELDLVTEIINAEWIRRGP